MLRETELELGDRLLSRIETGPPPATGPATTLNAAVYADAACATIPAEDFAAAVDVQRNIEAGMVTELQIGANEQALLDHLDAVEARTS